MLTLKDRFEQFMLSTSGVESIDQLMKHCVLEGRQKADYLACDRCVIIEQKSIDVNPDHKIQQFLDKLASAGRLPSGQMDWSLSELLRKVGPDGPALFDELRERVTKVLDDIIAKADDQTRDTKQTFLIPGAIGVVVVLNERASLIFPDIAMVKFFDMLRKRRQDGALRYVHNQVIVLISEAHVIESADEDVTMFSMATVYSDAGNEIPLATTYTESLKEKWAVFNNAGYLESSQVWDNFRPRDQVKGFTVVRPPPV